MGEAGEGADDRASGKADRRRRAESFRDRFQIPRLDEELPNSRSAAARRQRRNEISARAPGGARRLDAGAAAKRAAGNSAAVGLRALLEAPAGREISTTMAFVRMLRRW